MTARAALGILGIALLVVTAGCSGAGTFASGSDAPSAGDTPVSTPTATPTATPSPSPTPTPQTANLEQASVVEAHLQGLKESGSFRSTSAIAIETNDTETAIQKLSLSTNYRVDYVRDRAIKQSSFIGNTVTYTTGDTTYQQTKLSDDTSVEQATYHVSKPDDRSRLSSLEPVNRSKAAGVDFIVVDNISYHHAGTETYDGITVTRYEAEGTDDITGYEEGGPLPGATADKPQEEDESTMTFTGGNASNASIKSFSAVLRVDDRGVVRSSMLSMTVVDTSTHVSYTFEISLEITGVGESPIEEPNWVELAEQRANQSRFGGGSGSQTCDTPTAEGTFSQSPAGDGTYNVTYTVSGMEHAAVVTLEHANASPETAFDRSALIEGSTATATGLELGDTVTATATNQCGDTATVGTYTVAE